MIDIKKLLTKILSKGIFANSNNNVILPGSIYLDNYKWVYGKDANSPSAYKPILGVGTTSNCNVGQADLPLVLRGANGKSGSVLSSGGDLKIAGSITVGGHSSEIGDVQLDSGTSSRSDSTSSAVSTLGDTAMLALSKGTWVVTASVSFSANTRGNRFVKIVYGTSTSSTTDISASMVTQSPYTGWATRLHTSGIVTISSDSTNVYLSTAQNSGSSLSFDWYIKAVRIK